MRSIAAVTAPLGVTSFGGTPARWTELEADGGRGSTKPGSLGLSYGLSTREGGAACQGLAVACRR